MKSPPSPTLLLNTWIAVGCLACLGPVAAASKPDGPLFFSRHTAVSIVGEEFYINGQPTYKGRTWNGHRIQGLLFNSRMVQGIFDDRNPQTAKQWAYPDTGKWDAGR